METKGYELYWNDTGFNQYLYVQKIDKLPFNTMFFDETEYTHFYQVVTSESKVVLYLAKGYKDAPREVVPIYKNGKNNHSYKLNFKDAVKMAIQDAIYYQIDEKEYNITKK